MRYAQLVMGPAGSGKVNFNSLNFQSAYVLYYIIILIYYTLYVNIHYSHQTFCKLYY